MSNYEREPIAAVTDEYISADDGDTVFGKRWASQLITVNAEHLAALAEGKYLALDVQGEYVVYMQMKKEEQHV